MEVVPAGPSIMKHLASCNKSTRDKALKNLKTWLPTQPEVSADDMKVIWKGLFYCVWHADKAPVQSELIDRLSSLLLCLDLPLSINYFSVFLLTMRREWSGIDGLRLDKFYLLIRKFMFNFFGLMEKHSWDLELSRRLVGVLEEKTFFVDDKCQGNGVNYHIASVFLEELGRFLPIRMEIIDLFVNFFISIMAKSSDKVLLGKIRANIFDVLLKMGKSLLEVKKSGDDIDSGDEVVLFGTIALKIGFSAKLYESGSSTDCFQANRKVVLGLYEGFLKLENDLASSGIDISIPKLKNDDDDDEVPSLIPISTEGVSDESAVRHSTKKKKKKEKGEKAKPLDVVVNEVDGSVIKHSKKKIEKAKKNSDGSLKKTKMGDNKKAASSDLVTETSSGIVDVENVPVTNGDNLNNERDASEDNTLDLNEFVISNLQMQFEKIAAEAGMDDDDEDDGLSVGKSAKITDSVVLSKKRKRKRAKSMDGKNSDPNGEGEDAGVDAGAKSAGEKSEKKVRFSIKNNLVWKPHSPLPPENLRIPPSVTPRGSALKKGVAPGPIREMVPAIKKVKRVSYVKKGRKVIKRLKKVKTLSN